MHRILKIKSKHAKQLRIKILKKYLLVALCKYKNNKGKNILASIVTKHGLKNIIYLSSSSGSFIGPSTVPPLCKGCVHGFPVKERVSHI